MYLTCAPISESKVINNACKDMSCLYHRFAMLVRCGGNLPCEKHKCQDARNKVNLQLFGLLRTKMTLTGVAQ